MSNLRVDELESLTTGRTVTVDDIETEVRQDLANPDMGASMVARGVVAVDGIADLLALPEGQRKKGLLYLVKGYHAGSVIGGGEFHWDGESTATDNGGTILAVDGVSSGRFVRQYDGSLSVAWFGAIPNDTSVDNYDAIRATVGFALSNRNSKSSIQSIRFPAGIWTVKRNGVFSGFPYRGSFLLGLNIFGDGPGTTTIRLEKDNSVPHTWLYQTGSPENQYIGDFKFSNIQLTGTESGVSCISQYGTGEDKRFKFVSCYLSGFDVLMRADGTGNADLSSFVNCILSAREAFLVLNNSQSVVHNFVNCSGTSNGDVVRIETGGGGDVSFDGGNIEIWPSTGRKGYAVRMAGTGLINGMGVGNCNIIFNKVRFELASSGDGGCLVYTPETSIGPLNVVFRDCGLGNIRGSNERYIVEVNSPNTKVTLSGGTLTASNFRSITSASTATFGYSRASPAHLIIEDAMVYGSPVPAVGLSSKCEQVGNLARTTLRRNTQSLSDHLTQPMCNDIDKGYPVASHSSPCANVTRVAIRLPGTAWPNKTNENIFQLPEGIYVLRLYIERPRVTATIKAYQLFVGNADKSIVVGQSEASTFNDTHVIDVREYGRVNFTKWKIWAVTDAPESFPASPKIAYIEYI